MSTMQHTAQERCDRCPAQGYTTWGLGSLALTFCGHHTNKYADGLISQGFTVSVDDTIALHPE
jgi:hypothetical protein